MNCYKCGKEMRVVPEQVATDEKGLPVYHRIGYCDYCMSKFDIDIIEQNQKHTNQQNAPQKKKTKHIKYTICCVHSSWSYNSSSNYYSHY